MTSYCKSKNETKSFIKLQNVKRRSTNNIFGAFAYNNILVNILVNMTHSKTHLK